MIYQQKKRRLRCQTTHHSNWSTQVTC
jgi:hypothetical protein